MDKFDDYLEKQSKDENENFTLPKSFDNKIEETLLNLDKRCEKESKKLYLGKRIWTTAACFAFICLVGFGLREKSNLENMLSRTNEDSTQETTMESAIEQNNENQRLLYDNQEQAYGVNEESSNDEIENYNIINEDSIYSIKIEVVDESLKYKNITIKDDISKIIALIDSMQIYESIDRDINSWKYSIKVYGTTDHVYNFIDNLVSIDGVVYKTSQDEINELNKLYDTLNYEENFID